MATQTNARELNYGWANPNLLAQRSDMIANQRYHVYNVVWIILDLKQKVLINTLHTMAPYPCLTFFILHSRYVQQFLAWMRALAARFHFLPKTKTLRKPVCLHRGSGTLMASFVYLQQAGIQVKPVYLSVALRKRGLQSSPCHDGEECQNTLGKKTLLLMSHKLVTKAHFKP